MFFFNNWIILAGLAGISSNAFNFLNRFLLKDKDDPVVYAWYFETLRFVIFAVLAIFDWHIIITVRSVIVFVLLGTTEWISIYWYMKMHSHTHLSISAIISRTRLIWIAILAFFLVGENLKLIGYLGIIILFVGLSIVVAPRKLMADKGARYAALAAFMIALNSVLIKMALPFGSNSVINAILSLPPTFLFPLFMKNPRIRIANALRTNFKFKSLAVVVNSVSIFLFTIALRFGDTSKVTGIYQGMLITSVLAGILFLHERENIGRKLIGTAVTIVGVLLLA